MNPSAIRFEVLQMMTDLSVTTGLQPGKALRVAVDKGFLLVVAQGEVSIASPPPWFGEKAFITRSTFGVGDTYMAEHGGWIEISAQSHAQVRGLPRPAAPVPRGSRRAPWFWQLLGFGAA